jgi:hypothetical protein
MYNPALDRDDDDEEDSKKRKRVDDYYDNKKAKVRLASATHRPVLQRVCCDTRAELPTRLIHGAFVQDLEELSAKDDRTLMIRQLLPRTGEFDIFELFSKAGRVTDVRLMKEPRSGSASTAHAQTHEPWATPAMGHAHRALPGPMRARLAFVLPDSPAPRPGCLSRVPRGRVR